MINFLRDLFTEDGAGNTPWCLARISSFIALVAYLANATYTIYIGHTIAIGDFGTGLAALLIGMGGIIGFKQMSTKSGN